MVRANRVSRKWLFLAIILLPIVAFALLSGTSVLAEHVGEILETSRPSRAEMAEMIAEDEGVPTAAITIHVLDNSTNLPRVVYTIQGISEPAPVDKLPVVQRTFVHPRWQPWRWTLGGGVRGSERDPEEAASFSFSSASGDTGSDVNTVIFGVTSPSAAEVHLTVQGTTHVRDVRTTNGYLVLLSDQGLTPTAITEFRVLDENGNELPAPI